MMALTVDRDGNVWTGTRYDGYTRHNVVTRLQAKRGDIVGRLIAERRASPVGANLRGLIDRTHRNTDALDRTIVHVTVLQPADYEIVVAGRVTRRSS